MSRKRHGPVGGHDHGGGSHGDRPWVFFMIDCFMLILQFFVMTFKVKSEETILPQKMPPGGTVAAKTAVPEQKQVLYVSVDRPNGATAPVYEYMTKQVSLEGLAGTLAANVSSGKAIQVRVSYGANVPWADVMGVFNECAKAKITECGLVPIRGIDGPPRGAAASERPAS